VQRLTLEPSQIEFPLVTLTVAQTHYLRRVLRLEAGDRFQAIDGRGATYLVELQATQGRIIEELLTVNRELPLVVHGVIAVPKGNGLDDLVRACTELGVSQIHPVVSDRTQRAPNENRQQRWLKIAQEATEQCERAIVPTLHPLCPWSEVAARARGQKYFCVTRREAPHLLESLTTDGEIWLAIGPEGGWSEPEIDLALAQGWKPISLGPRILRTITAPIAALAVISSWLDLHTPKGNP
jgi:16S rRNA (uracil1498-N3)-methyltransferase